MRGLEGLREKLDAAHRSCADLREALHLEEVGGEGDLEEALREAAEVHEKIVALLEGRAGSRPADAHNGLRSHCPRAPRLPPLSLRGSAGCGRSFIEQCPPLPWCR